MDNGAQALVDHLFRHQAGRMIATLTRIFGPRHIDLAEEVVQEALIKALQQWPYRGVPENPLAWLIQVAKNRALELLYHVIESEPMLVDEICRDDTDLRRLFTRPPDTEVRVVATKGAIVALLRSSLATSQEKVRRFGPEKIEQLMSGLDGKQITKAAMLQFTLAHEMYHRGQLTVYQRLLGIEPALTERFRRLTSPNG